MFRILRAATNRQLADGLNRVQGTEVSSDATETAIVALANELQGALSESIGNHSASRRAGLPTVPTRLQRTGENSSSLASVSADLVLRPRERWRSQLAPSRRTRLPTGKS